jgi:hypothetical protein
LKLTKAAAEAAALVFSGRARLPNRQPGSGMLRATMAAKQEVRSMLEKLPDNCSLEDIQYHLYVLEKVRSGLQDARGNGAISMLNCA